VTDVTLVRLRLTSSEQLSCRVR